MKKSKLLLLWVITFITGVVVGGVCAYLWNAAHVQAVSLCAAARLEPEVLLTHMGEGVLPQGVSEVQEDTSPKSSAQLPSQLVRSELPQDIVLGSVAPKEASTQPVAGITLTDDQNTIVLRAQQPAQRAADGSNITMIEAPVALKRIQNLDQYKEFKRVARGSYPQADFAGEEVLVLESTSNLPDAMFEIVDVLPGTEQVKVLYRVNILGLDQKTNTHAAQKINKTALPIVLQQVL